MQDVLTKYCYHCAGFQKHVLHSTCIGNVVIAKHPLLSSEFDFSKLLKNMLIKKIALFLLFFRSLPFYLSFLEGQECADTKRERQWDISKQQRFWVASSQVEYWVAFSPKFCLFELAQPHRSISASLPFLQTILLVATTLGNWWTLLQTRGVVFPKRPIDAPSIFTPPATHNYWTYDSPTYAAGMSSDVETLRLCHFPS